MINKALLVEELQGIIVPIITPMTADQNIDFDTLDMIVEDLITTDIVGILPCGTTGQSATVTEDEHVALVEHIFKKIDGRTRFVASAGSNSTRQAIGLMNRIEDRIGPSTFLHVTGYYNSPPTEGIKRHYLEVANSVRHDESNIILYNVPSRTTANISAELTIELAQHPNIIGTKEASGDLDQNRAILEATDPTEFRVVSGEDHQILDLIKMGAFGSISAAANVAPKLLSDLTRECLTARESGDWGRAEHLQSRTNRLLDAVFYAKNPIPLAHLFGTDVRLPLCLLEEIDPPLQQIISEFDSSEELGLDLTKYRNS